MFRRDYSCSLCIFSRTAILIFLITSVGLAQDGSNKRGFSPGSSFSIGDIETINTTNGNLMLRFPLGVLTEGRDGLTGGINLYYSSKEVTVASRGRGWRDLCYNVSRRNRQNVP